MQPGLLRKGMAEAAGPAAGAPPEPMGSQAATQGNMADSGGVENVSAEEQEEYNRAMAAAMKLIHGDPKSQAAVVQAIDSKNPVGTIAQAAVTVITTVDQTLNLGETIIMPLLEEIVPLIIEVATESGRAKVTPKQAEQAIATATEMLLDEYGVDEESFNEVNSTVNPDEMGNVYKSTLAGE